MKSEKLIQNFNLYLDDLREAGAEPREMPEELKLERFEEVPMSIVLNHMAYMCEAGIASAEEGDIEKSMRWMCFLQGVLYVFSAWSIRDLIVHNRPSETDGDAL